MSKLHGCRPESGEIPGEVSRWGLGFRVAPKNSVFLILSAALIIYTIAGGK
jgi:hypothetical protein